jgi:hypothetical protein
VKLRRPAFVARTAFVIAALLALSGPLAMAAEPACFTSPSPLATAAAGNTDPACAVLAKVLATTAAPETAWVPGQTINTILKLTEGGFATDTFVLQFHVTTDFSTAFTTGGDELVRLSSSDASARTGSWWVPKEFVTDTAGRWLPVATIEDVLALPPQSDLKIVAYSGAIDAGTLGYVGIVAPAFNHRGGGIQFWFPREPVFTKDTSAPVGPAK